MWCRGSTTAGVPTARYADFDDPDEAIAFLDTLPAGPDGGYVVKTDGLAAGKGVLVTADRAEAEADIRAQVAADERWREELREVNGLALVRDLGQDLRVAARSTRGSGTAT